MVTLSDDVLNVKPVNIVKPIVNPENKMMHNPNLLHRNYFDFFSEITKIYPTNVLLIPTFHHTNQKTVLPLNHLFEIRLRKTYDQQIINR